MNEKKEPQKPPPRDLFNNAMVDAAMKAMTPEQVERYQKMGEYMYSTSNFEEKNPQPKSLEDETAKGIFYTREALKAGMHPKDLETKEIQLMYDIYGTKWYEEFGYEENEVPEPQLKIDLSGINTAEPLLTKKQLKKLEKRQKKREWKKNNPGKKVYK